LSSQRCSFSDIDVKSFDIEVIDDIVIGGV